MSKLVFTCIITESTAGHPNYTPVLPEYASNNQFVGMANFIYLVVEIGIELRIAVHFTAVLNHRMATQMCVRVKLKNRPPVYKLRTPDPPAQNKARKRRSSRVKT